MDAGCNPLELAEALEIDELTLKNPIVRLPDSTYLEMLHLAEKMLGSPGIGMKIGQEFRPQTFRDIGYVSLSCADVREALNLNTRYQRLTQEIGVTQLHFEGDNAVIVWTPYLDNPAYCRPITDVVFSGYFTMALWMAWSNAGTIMSKVQFQHSEAPYADLFAQRFNCQVEFDAPRNAMVFDAETAFSPLPQHNPKLVEIISSRLDRALEQFDRPQTIKDQTYYAIEALLPNQAPTALDVAKLIGVSGRTLRRRLSDQSVSFREVLQTVRQDSCAIHLRDPNVSLSNLAQKLGYSEQSAFTHAFRAWHDMSPTQYAARLHAEDLSG